MSESSPPPMKLVGRAARSFARIVDGEFRDFGLAMGQLPVLMALKNGQALSQAELARLAQVEQPSMAQLLNRMERDGLVERLPDPADKRSRLISLTARASALLPRAKAVMDARTVDALAGFTPDERAQLIALLRRLNTNLDQLGGNSSPCD